MMTVIALSIQMATLFPILSMSLMLNNENPIKTITDPLSRLLLEGYEPADGILTPLLSQLSFDGYAPKTKNSFENDYDYIVVGAGSAGSTVAGRLSEMSCVRVLLLEAGKSPPLATEIPITATVLPGTDLDWNYKSVPQRRTAYGLRNRVMPLPAGKVVGGSSTINAMYYVRGNRHDYDLWASLGAVGWNYDAVLRYFKKAENNQNPEIIEPDFHNFSGPLTVMKDGYDSEFRRAFYEGARYYNHSIIDANGRSQTGIYNYQGTLRDGRRCSAAKAYLVPADERPNLTILKEAFVTKILIKNQVAIGVQFDFKGGRHSVYAKREVILSAGALNSPRILMLSGIGPKDHLAQLNIPVIADLPVGNNLQDHVAGIVRFEMSRTVRPVYEKLLNPANVLLYLTAREGPFSLPAGISNIAFLDRKSSSDPRPDYELYLGEADAYLLSNSFPYDNALFPIATYLSLLTGKSVFSCVSQILHPKSRGTVRLNSSNPYDPPIIDTNYFAEIDDWKDVVEGMKHCHEILSTPPLKKLGARPALPVPGCEIYVNDLEKYYGCLLRFISMTIYHYSGTNKMGDPSKPDTVVDPELRVNGIKNLRVVDASVMPTVPCGNTNAPTIMIGEKASDMIRGSVSCQ